MKKSLLFIVLNLILFGISTTTFAHSCPGGTKIANGWCKYNCSSMSDCQWNISSKRTKIYGNGNGVRVRPFDSSGNQVTNMDGSYFYLTCPTKWYINTKYGKWESRCGSEAIPEWYINSRKEDPCGYDYFVGDWYNRRPGEVGYRPSVSDYICKGENGRSLKSGTHKKETGEVFSWECIDNYGGNKKCEFSTNSEDICDMSDSYDGQCKSGWYRKEGTYEHLNGKSRWYCKNKNYPQFIKECINRNAKGKNTERIRYKLLGKKILNLSDAEKNDSSAISFKTLYMDYSKTYGDTNNVLFSAWGADNYFGYIRKYDKVHKNVAIILIEILKQIDYVSENIIDSGKIYKTGNENYKGIEIQDMGGAKNDTPENLYLGNAGHGGNFHVSIRVADFGYFRRGNGSLYIDLERKGNTSNRNAKIETTGEVNEGNFDRLRTALFRKYLQDLNLKGSMYSFSLIKDFVQKKVNCKDCEDDEKELLKKLGLYQYEFKNITKDDHYGHYEHMHINRTYSKINWDEFNKDYWYFNQEESELNECEEIGGYFQENGWCVSTGSDVPKGHGTATCIDSEKSGKGPSSFFTEVENTNLGKSNGKLKWSKCYTDRRIQVNGENRHSKCQDGAVPPWLNNQDEPKNTQDNGKPVGYFDSIKCENGNITVKGRAYDKDYNTKSIDIHIYEGEVGDFSKILKACKADKERKDVNEKLKVEGNHGFECSIEGMSDGEHLISVYALNRPSGSGKNPNISEKAKVVECKVQEELEEAGNGEGTENGTIEEDVEIKPNSITVKGSDKYYKTTIKNNSNEIIIINFKTEGDVIVKPKELIIPIKGEKEIEIKLNRMKGREIEIEGEVYEITNVTKPKEKIKITIQHGAKDPEQNIYYEQMDIVDEVVEKLKNKYGVKEIYSIIELLKKRKELVNKSSLNEKKKNSLVMVLDYIIDGLLYDELK